MVNRKKQEDCKQARTYEVNRSSLLKSPLKYSSPSSPLSSNNSSGSHEVGFGLNGAFEDLAMVEIKTQYETNVFGLIRTIQ